MNLLADAAVLILEQEKTSRQRPKRGRMPNVSKLLSMGIMQQGDFILHDDCQSNLAKVGSYFVYDIMDQLPKCPRCGGEEWPDNSEHRYRFLNKLLERWMAEVSLRQDQEKIHLAGSDSLTERKNTDAWQMKVAGSQSGTIGDIWDRIKEEESSRSE